MTLQRTSFSPNTQLSCVQTDKFKAGVITFSLTRPMTRESYSLDLLLSGILRRGTVKYPSMADISRRLDDLYAATVEVRSSRIGKNLSLSLSAEMLDDSYTTGDESVIDGVIDMLCEIIFSPKLDNGSLFPQKHLDQEIRFAVDSVRAQINNPRSYAAIRCDEIMNRNDPSLPTLDELENELTAIDTQMLTDHYRRTLNNSRLDIFYVGSLSLDEISKKLKARLPKRIDNIKTDLIFPSPDSPLTLMQSTQKMPVSQGKLSLGFRTGVGISSEADDSPRAILFNEIFGASPASKLFMNVREKLSLCYYCSSSYNRYSGNIIVSAGIENEKRQIAEAEILKQLDEIRNGNISEYELHAAKTSLENSYKQIYDNPFELQSFYGNRALFGMTDSIESCMKKMSSVSVDDIIDVARSTVLDTIFFIEGTRDVLGEEDEDE